MGCPHPPRSQPWTHICICDCCSRGEHSGVCLGWRVLVSTHANAHAVEVPPTRPVRGTSNLYLGAEGGSRVLGRDSSARCIALVCGSQVREMGPCVGKKLPSHDPDSHFTAYVAPKALHGCKVSRES